MKQIFIDIDEWRLLIIKLEKLGSIRLFFSL
jgi:hypothetical protein